MPASVPLDLPACDIEEKSITQDGLEVSLTIVRPADNTGTLPGFLFIHGGGWQKRVVRLERHDVPYDFLIFATGVQ